MDEATRAIGVEQCMGVVMREVHARGLVPAVLIAVHPGGGPPAVLPCGPGIAPEKLRELIQAAASSPWERPH